MFGKLKQTEYFTYKSKEGSDYCIVYHKCTLLGDFCFQKKGAKFDHIVVDSKSGCIDGYDKYGFRKFWSKSRARVTYKEDTI